MAVFESQKIQPSLPPLVSLILPCCHHRMWNNISMYCNHRTVTLYDEKKYINYLNCNCWTLQAFYVVMWKIFYSMLRQWTPVLRTEGSSSCPWTTILVVISAYKHVVTPHLNRSWRQLKWKVTTFVFLRNQINYLWIICNTPSYLELWFYLTPYAYFLVTASFVCLI